VFLPFDVLDGLIDYGRVVERVVKCNELWCYGVMTYGMQCTPCI